MSESKRGMEITGQPHAQLTLHSAKWEPVTQLEMGGFFPTSLTYNNTKQQQGGIYPSLNHLRRQIHRSQMSPKTCKTYVGVL